MIRILSYCILFVVLSLPSIVIAAPNSGAPLMLQPQKSGNMQGQNITQPNITQLDIKDIAPPVAIHDYTNIILLLGCLLLLGGLAAALYYYLKKKKVVEEVTEKPYEKALRELEEAKTLLDSSDHEAYTQRITSILRNYIDSQFQLRATSLTTSEFFAQVEAISNHFDPLYRSRELLTNCLSQVDMIKFAKSTATSALSAELEKTVRKFIIASSHTREDE